MAFVNDTIPVGVEIERLGAASAGAGKVQLIEKSTGRVLDERDLPTDEAQWKDQRTRVTLTTREAGAGKLAWQVRLVPAGQDLVAENNRAEINIELVDRPMRVAYFDGYPRWQARYLRNLLTRENSIRSASLLLASSRRYMQEGDITLETLPRSPEEWAQFDVIVIGDLPPTVFSREQLEQIKDHVAVRGAGLLWIGGPAATPSAWRDTPLADLLPFTLGSSDAGQGSVRKWEEPVLMAPMPAAQRLSLLELGESTDVPWPAALTDPGAGWSRLWYAQAIDPASLKPTAEVLARFIPLSEVGVEGAPVHPGVLSMRYGAGRVLYVATDEIWRWRYARGEVLPERFWLPLLRLQGRESLARGSRPAVIEVAPRRAQVEQPVRIAVQLVDQSLADAAPASITVRIRRADPDEGVPSKPVAEVTLAPEPDKLESGGPGRARGARSYASSWVPADPGRYILEPADPLLANLQLSADLDVALPDDELRHPETDHPLLARLAEQTEGQVLPVSRLTSLPELLPKREVHIAGTPDIETLWDKPVVLILLVLLLTLEWVGRRLIRLP
jgi:hypothetical protein